MTRQEEQFRLALELTQTGVWDWDLITGTIDWNDSNYTLLGYQPREVESTYQAWRDRVHPDDIAATEQKLFQVQENHSNYEAEFRVIYPDGTIHWLLGKGQGIYDETGQLVRMIGTLVNITQRKQSEIDLREEQEKLSLFIKYAPVSVAMFDRQMNYLSVSQRWLEIYHLASAESIIGHSHYEIFPNISDTWKQVHQRCLAGATEKCDDDFFILPDGSVQWLKWEVLPWRLDTEEIGGILIFVDDVTERKQAEIALQKNEQLLQLAMTGAKAGTWDWELATGKLSWSPETFALYGLEPTETLNYETWYQTQLHPEDRPWVNPLVSQIINKRQQDFQLEFRCIHPEKGIFWLLSLGHLTVNAEGEPVRISGINLDITEHKQAEIALQDQIARERLVANIAQNIRETLEIDQVLQRTVDRVREFLQADRAIIFHFQPDWTGTVITESVGNDYPSILYADIYDPCFVESYLEPYRQGLVTTRTDFYADDIEPCYLEMMQPFQVRANLAVPILLGQELWGLLIIHQCSAPRQWQETEIQLTKQLTVQVGIAIKQAELYQQTLQELLERKKTEKALLESEQKLQTILEYAPAAIYLIDLENRHLLANRRYAELLNTTPDKLIGNSIYDFWSKDIADIFAANNLKIVQNKQVLEAEEIVPQSDGLHTYISLKFPIYDAEHNVYAVCGISTDITERKQAEQKIAEQAALIDIATDAIFVHDSNDTILFWSKGAERLYGWTEAEVLGQKSQSLFNQDINQSLSQAIQKAIAEGSWTGELEQLTKEGKKIIVESCKTRIEFQFAQSQAVLVVNSDITQKKQLEKQFYHAQRLEGLGTLASGIAHDFNNILTPILGVSQLLALKFVEPDEKTERLLTLLSNSARRGADLVKQILLFGHNTEGESIVLQLGYVLKELIAVAKQTFPKSIEISSEISTEKLWKILADSTQMHQVFLNLMVNARDAMPNGGKLTIRAENLHLEEQMNFLEKVGDYVMITVADTGEGVPPELLERIFDPFFTTKEIGKGTGLGLSTVNGIVKNRGGFIKVYSEVEKGTEFKVFLPAAEGEANVSAQELEDKKIELPRGQGELVLIVDDEAFIREIAKTALQNYNYQTMLASDGIEAIALYREHQQKIDVVLMDMMMPNLDGVATIKMLQEINPQMKVIVTTGLLDHQNTALLSEVKIFLPKPYTLKQLLIALRETIDSGMDSGRSPTD